MIDVLRVGHATFTTPDLERQVAYYSDVLGLIVTERDKNRAFLATRTGLEAICARARRQAGADAAVVPGRAGRRLRRLRDASCPEHGIKSEQRNGISPGAARALVFTDIKGTVIELYSDYVFAKDDGKQAAITPLKLGHVAHRVDDVQKMVKFYTDVLGFRVSDWHADTFAFLRCGVDHHTVNFVYDADAAASPHRLRGEGLAGDPPRLRLPRQEQHPAGVGAGPPHHRPQRRGLSPQRRQRPRRAVSARWTR